MNNLVTTVAVLLVVFFLMFVAVCRRRGRIGYCIVAGSEAFSSQSDHINALQWLYLLRQQGVDWKDIWVWLPTEDGCTVRDPRPSVLGPPLVVPEDRIFRSLTAGRERFFGVLQGFFADDAFDRVVWIFLDHGNERALALPRDRVDLDTFRDLCTQSFGAWRFHKKFLIILDSCGSGTFARNALGGVGAQHETWVLTAGPKAVYTSAIVLGEPRSAVSHSHDRLNYGIFSAMFSRKLLDLIAYTNQNPWLSEVPGLLNGEAPVWRNGFQAEVHSLSSRRLRLRDFFGRACSPNDLVALGEAQVRFSDILPPLGSDGLFDDVGRGLEGDPGDLTFRCVIVQVDEEGRLTPGTVRFLDGENDEEKDIIQDVEAQRCAPLPEEPEHVPLIHILLVLWDRLGRRKGSLHNPNNHWKRESGFSEWLEARNGVTVAEDKLIDLFRPYYESDGTELKEIIATIREELLKDPDLWRRRERSPPRSGESHDEGNE